MHIAHADGPGSWVDYPANDPFHVAGNVTEYDGLTAKPALIENSLTVASNGDRILVGSGAGDLLSGAAGHDEIYGLGGDDQLDGNGGNDSLTGGAGSDSLDGGDGTDTAIYSGNRADYTVT
jgi:Ca2+-binding RTX toxin-like protein